MTVDKEKGHYNIAMKFKSFTNHSQIIVPADDSEQNEQHAKGQ